MSSFSRIRQRFAMRGVFWRHLLEWATGIVPHYIEPQLLATWTFFFYAVWPAGRRAVCANLRVIAPGGFWQTHRRALRVFWNFACTFTDTMHFSVSKMQFDWDVEGEENLERLTREDRAIILTAHMGNYDLGSYVFAKRVQKPIVIVRAAEHDEASDRESRAHRERVRNDLGTIRYFEPSSDLAIALVSALQENNVVAIQGDRAIEGVTAREVELFGHRVQLPAGPFALALATGAPLYPLFVVRDGRRQYRVIAGEPFSVVRTGRDRDRDIDNALQRWAATLEALLRREPEQWFTFFPFFENAAA